MARRKIAMTGCLSILCTAILIGGLVQGAYAQAPVVFSLVPWGGALVAGGSSGLGRVAVAGGSVLYPGGLLPVSTVLNGLRPAPATGECD